MSKEKKELSAEELKKASGGMRGPGSLDEVQPSRDTVQSRDDLDTEQRMGNRPVDISRQVQGKWKKKK